MPLKAPCSHLFVFVCPKEDSSTRFGCSFSLAKLLTTKPGCGRERLVTLTANMKLEGMDVFPKILYASVNGVQSMSHCNNTGFWTSEYISTWYVLVGRPTALPVSPSPTYQHASGWSHNMEVGRTQCTARTFRMLRTDVSAMIYQALKIEIRHGSADDQFAIALLIVS